MQIMPVWGRLSFSISLCYRAQIHVPRCELFYYELPASGFDQYQNSDAIWGGATNGRPGAACICGN
jgi:hypothetical protein